MVFVSSSESLLEPFLAGKDTSETTIADISSLLMNERLEILIEIEEQSDDAVRQAPTLPVRWTREKLPTGIGCPYALLDIEEGSYTTKDRII